MRTALAITLLIFACSMVAEAQALNEKVTLSARSLTVGEALRQIEFQTRLSVAYTNNTELNRNRTVAFSKTEGTAGEFVTRILSGTGLTYEMKDGYIVLKPVPVTAPKPAPVAEPVHTPEAVQGYDVPAVVYREVLTPEPVPAPAPKGNYPTAGRLTETPRWAIKTNLLWDATASIYLAPEVRLARKTTLDLPVMINWWEFADNRKWKHTLFQPGVRFWSCEAFNGFFWGLHLHGGIYNVGRLPSPPFSDYAGKHRFEGWLLGGGASIGYHWMVGKRWSVEAEAGAGYAYLDYKTFECADCGRQVGSETKNYFGPTKAAVSLIFMIK